MPGFYYITELDCLEEQAARCGGGGPLSAAVQMARDRA